MKLMLFIILLVSYSALNAQTLLQPQDLNLLIEPIAPMQIEDNVIDPMASLTSQDTVALTLKFSIPDTLNAINVVVKVGTADASSDIVAADFILDGSPSAPFTFQRIERDVTIGLGTYNYSTVYYCQVYLRDANGNVSEIANYTTAGQ